METLMYQVLEKGTTPKGNDIELYGISGAEHQVLVIGVVHGDEPQGRALIERYMRESDSKNILFIPSLNPDGEAENTRVNSSGVDINRNFPTKNWEWSEHGNYYGGVEPASEIETRFVMNILEKYKPSAIITLHTPYEVVNYDGPAQELANMISDIIGYPVESNIGYPTPGSFGTYAGVERNIPTITLEMDEHASVDMLYKYIKQIFDNLYIV